MESGDEQYLSGKEEAFVRILTDVGVRKPDSRVLVFPAHNSGMQGTGDLIFFF